ncbi:hypothetical protein EVAR_28263_1 [Eumeta japonica]|uniref:Uncharacterized protein n=1 Tax=Eumeta variegata TaxID=151549 RepID=A0A4C1V671_EUMVA|nr:hypothetical protein EVAR_28263_1 [Eumeta japonica]
MARAGDELRELVVKTGISVRNVSKALATSVSSFKSDNSSVFKSVVFPPIAPDLVLTTAELTNESNSNKIKVLASDSRERVNPPSISVGQVAAREGPGAYSNTEAKSRPIWLCRKLNDAEINHSKIIFEREERNLLISLYMTLNK